MNGILGEQERADLFAALKARFEANSARHVGLEWAQVLVRLEASMDNVSILHAMEESGGEPDVVLVDEVSGEVTFFDCSKESPDRRSLCYDDESLAARKEHKPKGSALGFAASIGANVLDEHQYLHLQSLGEFDLKTSSWVLTPPPVRALGGSLFGDRRFGRVFFYQNGAESYYASRGVRCCVSV